MLSVLAPVFLFLWGVVLAFGYQLFLRAAEGIDSTAAGIFYYCFAGLSCFFATALFLYGVSGGSWGFYGFCAVAAGFFVYERFCRRFGRRVIRRMAAFYHSVRRIGHFIIEKTVVLLTFPWAFIVDKGERFFLWRRRKKEERTVSKDGEEK